jgi:hypothetical protein
MPVEPIDTTAIERRAYDLLARAPEFIWDGETLPVPVDDIVDNMLGLRVRLVDDMSQAPGCDDLEPGGVSGLLLTDLGEIWVNRAEAEQWEGRRRFTIGHEVGHYLIHQESESEVRRIFCRTADIAEDDDDTVRDGPTPKPRAELEADAFAAAMLMPEHLIREHAATCGEDIETMKALFHCSHKAMKYRLNRFVRP